MELFRAVSFKGEALVVKVLAGIKVLVSSQDSEDLVLPQPGRCVRLSGELPSAPVAGACQHLDAHYCPLPDRGDCAFGFKFEDSVSGEVYMQDLPEGCEVFVLPLRG